MAERIYCLSYADDIMVLAERKENMRELIKRLEKYLNQKMLCLNMEKTKIMRFNVGGVEWNGEERRWKK